MARFVFSVWPFAGHVHPAIAIGNALRARGHEVAFYTGRAVQTVVQQQGFDFFPFECVDEARITTLVSSEFPFSPSYWRQILNARHTHAKFREWLLGTIPQQIQDLERILSKWKADVVICDMAFWGPFLVLHEKLQIPVTVLSVSAACVVPGPDAPVWGNGLPRPHSVWTRFTGDLQRTLLERLSVVFRTDVNAVRSRYGLPALDVSVTEFAARMPLYLVPSTPEYDYDRKDLPQSVQYVGPCLWDRPANALPPAWLSELPSGQPLIYVTEATIGTTEPFLLKTAARALKDLPMQVVMTTGHQRNPDQLRHEIGSANIRLESYVPQSDLMQRCAVMVTLGGSGGVLAALKAGVPLVVVPTEWDRPENAQRVVEAGAGIRIAPHRCTPERLRSAVLRVLQEPSFRENAHRLARSFAQFPGPPRAAELLEQLGSAGTISNTPRHGTSLAASC